MLVTILHLPSTIEGPQSFNSFCGSSERYTAMNCIELFLNQVLRGQSLWSDHAYNITNMRAMSYRSDFSPCSGRVNIQEPSVCFTLSVLSAVFQIDLPSFLMSTATSDSKTLNTSLLEVMICSKNEHVFIRDLSNLTLQIIFDVWWASMNVGSKQPFAWNNSRHARSWLLYSHCGIEASGSPGSICIICHQVLRHPSEHGTSSMG